MSEPRVNTQTDFDFWIGLVFFLIIAGRILGPVSRAVDRLMAPGPVRLPAMDMARVIGIVVVVLLLLAVLASRRLRARLGLDEALAVLWSATMSMVGAPLVWFASFVVGLLLMLLLSAVGAGAVNGVALGLGMFIGVPLAAYWSGWRFGKWGYFWGCVSFVFLVAIVVVRAEPPLDPPTVRDAIIATFLLLLSAAAGRAGAVRFQAGLREDKGGPEPLQPSAEAHPG